MALPADSVMQHGSVSTSKGLESVARRRPTPADWQRWKPTITDRYKRATARMIVQEMNAKYLLVTEKMYRDRLHLWGLKKNQRRGGGAKSSASNEDTALIPRSFGHHVEIARCAQPEPTAHQAVHNPLPIPKDARLLQRVLRSLLDWQNHFHDSGLEREDILAYTDSFYSLLRKMSVALNFPRSNQIMCGNATRRLGEASTAFQTHLDSTCTPLAILSSIQLLLRIVGRRDTDEWYRLTSGFLLHTAAEILPPLHPTLLLLRAILFDVSTAEGLAMIYNVGSNIIARCYGESNAIEFRLDFISAALDIHPNAAFASGADMLCHADNDARYILSSQSLAEPRNSTSDRRACQSLDRDPPVSERRSREAFQYTTKCSHHVRYSGSQRSVRYTPSRQACEEQRAHMHRYAWRILCNSQRMQCGFAGEEVTRLNAHTLITTMATDPHYGSEPISRSSQIVRELDLFYEEHDLAEQREALRLEYPSVFKTEAVSIG